MAVPFSQQNVDTHIAELQALPPADKRPIQAQLRQSFTGYLRSVFEFDQTYLDAFNGFTSEENEMWGMGAATGIDTNNTLTVTAPTTVPPPQAAKKSKKKFEVSAEHDFATGTSKVSVSMEWSWD